ncbi:TasA family protein [Fictibacillus sp. NPDC058756]|uniref:TasA family protein n=1 Tax=Fictibacillus sp. NPDC058756 TaxID=3346625 RepID=UPI0036CBC967
MNLKKKLVTSATTIAVGAMATIGGTFAYFSDEVTATSKFTNGTINLQPEAPYLEHFTLTNWKPGDKLEANNDNQEPAMVLNNQGTLPMNVFMDVDVSSVKGSSDAIYVTELKYGGIDLLPKYQPGPDGKLSLAELATQSTGNTTLNGTTHTGIGKFIGNLDAPDANSTTDKPIKAVTYVLDFTDTGINQNTLMGDETSINFKFTGLQYEGETFSQQNGNIDNNSTGGGGNFQRTDNVNNADTVDRNN